MATVTKKKRTEAAQTDQRKVTSRGIFLIAAHATFRFLASLKLAVFSLLTLALSLSYATFYEKIYGTKGVQERIYQSWGFGLLLAMLGANILCAALIRYPWKRRQLGFVVTHAGLLVVLLGSLLSFWLGSEGQVAFVEGDSSQAVVQTQAPVIRLRPLDPRTGKPTKEFILDFRPGAFEWTEGRTELLSHKEDPFSFKVKHFLPASIGKYIHRPAASDESAAAGMIRVGLTVTPPGPIPRPMDALQSDIQDRDKWFVAQGRFRRKVRELGGIRVVFQQVEREASTILDDFLNPPKALVEFARIHYTDVQGKPRVHEWVLDESQVDRSVDLPDSDLNVTYQGSMELPPQFQQILGNETGEEELPGVKFNVRKGAAKPLIHYGWWAPLMPSFVPSEGDPKDAKGLVTIGYFHPPHLDAGGVRGQVEVLAFPDGTLFSRYANRNGVQTPGPLEVGRPFQVGGGPNQPMTLSFEVKEFLPRGKETFTFVPIDLGPGKKGDGVPAALAEMTVDGETREFWLRGRGDYEPSFGVYTPSSGRIQRSVSFPGVDYEAGYDADRKDLPFSLKLVDFDVRFDPGTRQPKSYTSKVLLTDVEKHIQDELRVITMNEPLTHRGWTFYQAGYNDIEDPRTGQSTGQFLSILQVRKDPVWGVIYSGCLLVVVGTFLQFYMRAGIFTDGGKREREQAATRAARQSADSRPSAEPDDEPETP